MINFPSYFFVVAESIDIVYSFQNAEIHIRDLAPSLNHGGNSLLWLNIE